MTEFQLKHIFCIIKQLSGGETSWSKMIGHCPKRPGAKTSRSKKSRGDTSCVRNFQIQNVQGRNALVQNLKEQNVHVQNIKGRNVQVQKGRGVNRPGRKMSGGETTWSEMSRSETSRSKNPSTKVLRYRPVYGCKIF